MNIRFYLDIWPSSKPSDIIYATANPGAKIPGCKRFAFDVTVPEHLLFEPDVVSPEVKGPFVVGDQDANPNG